MGLIASFFAFFIPTWIDGVAFFANIGSVGALALNRKWLGWILGLAGSVALLYVYANAGFVFDSTLMVYYIITSIIGAIIWAVVPSRRNKKDLAITEMPARYWKWAALFVAAFTGLGGWLILSMGWTTLGLFVYVDALTTGISIVAQWMLAKKWFSNWYLWIVADIIDIWLYFTKGLPMVAVLVIVYLAQCLFALWNWTRIRHQQEGDADVLYDNQLTTSPAL